MNVARIRSLKWALFLAGVFVTCPVGAEEKTWTTCGFLDFIDGRFADGGVNTYVAADGTIRLFNLWDLNNDGNFDLPVACAQDHDEQTDLCIYWGSPDGYSAARRSSLETINCSDVAIADVNRDGHPDVIFANEGNTEAQSGVMIYLGDGKGGFSEHRRLKLPGVYSSAVNVADLNADGYVEIILANMYRLNAKPDPPTGNSVRTYRVNSYVYWGSADGYSTQRRTQLPTTAAQAAAVADLNGDGLPDVVFANGAGEVSFVYYNGPEGFFPHRRSQVVTSGAHDVAIEDLNRDGHPDLIFANYANEGFFDTQSYVYWGSPAGFSRDRRSGLPTSGASGIVVADLNGNGRKDIVFINKIEGVSYAGGTTASLAIPGPTTSWIYWGDDRGRFSPQRRQGLPTTRGADSYVNADVNADGYVDLLFAHGSSPTIIYWGGPRGTAKENKSAVLNARSGTARVADFNRDGYLDLLTKYFVIYGQKTGFSQIDRFAFVPPAGYPTLADLNRDGWLDVISPLHNKVLIYWNSPHGFDNQRTSELPLPGKGAAMAETADFNRDGFLDLVVVIHIDSRKPLEPGEVAVLHASAHTESYIYWGGAEGYSASRRLALPTVGCNDAVAADLNADGYVDLFFPSYLGGIHRHFPGYIYWNGPDGFNATRRALIPGFSGCGAFAADCNLDGYQELIVANHTRVGNHRSDIWVYWGSEKGYSPQNRSSLPATGPHFFSLIDIGDVYDRSDRYDYISPPFNAGANAEAGTKWKQISWLADTPFRTRVELQIRTAATREELKSAAWRGPTGSGTFYLTPGEKIEAAGGQQHWIQYKASLISPNSTNTPILHKVSIRYALVE